jgi:hypothetical protein
LTAEPRARRLSLCTGTPPFCNYRGGGDHVETGFDGKAVHPADSIVPPNRPFAEYAQASPEQQIALTMGVGALYLTIGGRTTSLIVARLPPAG